MLPYLQFSSSIELHKVEKSENYILKHNGLTLSISKLLYLIIFNMQKGKSVSDIASTVNSERILSRNITEDEILEIIKGKILPLISDLDASVKTNPAKNVINLKLTLVKYEQIRLVLQLMLHLFRPKVAAIGLLLGAAATLFMLHASANEDSVFTISSNYYIVFLLGMFAMAIFHEFGHATAALNFKVEPKEIGFGLYLFFPVLYADVTDIWRLSRLRRIIVNLAGVYFQLISHIILAVIWTLVNDESLRKALVHLVVVSSTLIIININPFLKFDGYWVYVDAFSIPNLKSKSMAFMKNTMQAIFGKGHKFNWPGPALFFYSTGQIIFLVFLFFAIINLTPKLFVETYEFFLNTAYLEVNSVYVYEALHKIIMCFALTFFIVSILKDAIFKFFKFIRNI